MITTLLKIASLVLVPAAAFDGASTVHFLKNPIYEEGNPLLVWVYGTNRPKAKAVYFRGGLVIAGEILAGLAMSHFSIFAGYAFGVGFLAQSAAHIYLGVGNFKIR